MRNDSCTICVPEIARLTERVGQLTQELQDARRAELVSDRLKVEAERRITELQAERDGVNAAAVDYEAWLGAALKALGVKTVFDIPDYKTHLAASIKDQKREHEAAVLSTNKEKT